MEKKLTTHNPSLQVSHGSQAPSHISSFAVCKTTQHITPKSPIPLQRKKKTTATIRKQYVDGKKLCKKKKKNYCHHLKAVRRWEKIV